MRIRFFGPAGFGAITSACALSLYLSPAWAQRAASTPSAETGLAAEAAPPPPPGFPGASSPIVFGGTIQTHLQGEWTAPSGDKSHRTLFDDTDLQLFANYQNWFSINSDIKLERNQFDNLQSYYPVSNRFLDQEGLTMRQLYATLRPADGLAVYGGKIHPNFGSAYEAAPGIFYNFGTDYEQDERIGIGVEYRLPGWLGKLGTRISLETFYLDTTFLSTSLFSHLRPNDRFGGRPGRYERSMFGPSNTGGLNSFTAAVRAGVPENGLSGQLSFTQEATSDPAGRTERGVSIGATYDPSGDGIRLGSRLGATPFLEYTHFENFGNEPGLTRDYLVGGLTFQYSRWQAILAGGYRRSSGAEHANDHQENLTISYKVTEALSVAGGVNHINLAGLGSSWTVGPSLTYELGF